jgi:hypothetical protein
MLREQRIANYYPTVLRTRTRFQNERHKLRVGTGNRFRTLFIFPLISSGPAKATYLLAGTQDKGPLALVIQIHAPAAN